MARMCETCTYQESDDPSSWPFTPSVRFGTGVNISGDLLNEPLSVVSGTASLTDSAIAKSQAMRMTARMELARMQDDRSMREGPCWHVLVGSLSSNLGVL